MDTSLVERARDGDLEAFECLVEERVRDVYRLALAIVGNEADAHDVTQDAFVSVWRQLPRLRDAGRFEGWFGRIVVNQARMSLRSRRRRRIREIPADEILAHAAQPSIGSGDDVDTLRRGLRAISVDHRVILAMHHLDGRSIADIAEALGIAAGTVKSRLFTARQALTRAIAEDAS